MMTGPINLSGTSFSKVAECLIITGSPLFSATSIIAVKTSKFVAVNAHTPRFFLVASSRIGFNF